MDTLAIALSGMQSAQSRLAVSAHNVANTLTQDFHPQRSEQVSLSSGGAQARVRTAPKAAPVQLEREIVDQIQARTQYLASARVFQAGSDLSGALFDIFA